jgi:hypothetical protein
MLPALPVSLSATQTIAALWVVGLFAAASQVTVLSPYRALVTSLPWSPGGLGVADPAGAMGHDHLFQHRAHLQRLLALDLAREAHPKRPSLPNLGVIRTDTGSK